eukprot:3427128-Amphidinium_carterae.1
MARHPEEQRIRSELIHQGVQLAIFVLPGSTVQGGSQKDRRRTSATVSLMTVLAANGSACILCLPRSSPSQQMPEIQALRSRADCIT